ncbi:MAG: threonine dehydratase [Verrucomicrobiota bacterium]
MFPLPGRSEIEQIAPLIDGFVPPTPQFSWPLLNARTGCELWVKHENHTAIGSFKIRGAVAYLARLREREPATGVIAATRGNFGQAVAFAATRQGFTATVVAPHGNNPEKNRAMRALGAELIEHGADFQAAIEHSIVLARERGLHAMPSFHRDLVLGNAVSALHFLKNAPALDAVYVPIGLGSGICALAAAREALGLPTRLIGVASTAAPGIALSFASRQLTAHPATTRIADGMACSTPHPDALALILKHVERIVTVTDDEVEAAIRIYFSDTHNIAEGAAAAALAAVLQDRAHVSGRRIGIVCSGGNIDTPTFARLLAASSA